MAEIPNVGGGQRTNFDENRHIAGYSSDQEVTNAATILCEVSGNNIGQKTPTDKDDDGSSSHQQEGTGEEVGERRSRRKRRPVRRLSLSPLEEEPAEEAPSTVDGDGPTRILNAKEPISKRGRPRSETFSCDICKSNFIIPPMRKKGKGRRSWRLSVRYWLDPESNKKLTLCNACGLRATRNRSTPKAGPASEEEKNRYFASVQKFSQSLVTELKDPDAERLACPYFRTRTPCACVQKFIIGDGTQMEEAKKRAGQLLQLLKEAQRLRNKKFYNVEDVMKKAKKQRKVGIGNGQRKSLEYQELVLNKRAVLKDQLKFCEHATKRILLYSNNFLHKRLKTDPVMMKRRLEGNGNGCSGGPKKSLKEIDELADEVCCDDRCVLLAQTHKVLLQKWRDRARSGQTEARKVLGEMLTPSGLKTNCHKFITMVTGCSAGTITRVEEQIRTTGGDREPPPHGLKKYWEQHWQRIGKAPPKKPSEPAVPSISTTLETGRRYPSNAQPTQSEKQLKDQLLQLKKMQNQLTAQQSQINQQQKTIEKQLSLMNKQKQEIQRSRTTQYRNIQPHPAPIQTSKETIGICPMSTPGDNNSSGSSNGGGFEGINANVQQNMNQLLMNIQHQLANQQVLQIQQQLMNVSGDATTLSASLDQPPPSYNMAVALANGTSLGQPVGVPGQVILQALPLTCGDTITIHAQPMEETRIVDPGAGPGLGIITQNETGQNNGNQSQDASSAAQSFLVSIPDIIEVDSLGQDVMPDVIEIPESETFTVTPFTEGLQTSNREFNSAIEVTMTDMAPSAPTPRSMAAILRRRPRNVPPAVATTNIVGFPHVIVTSSLDTRPFSELPGDMLMASDPLQALSSTSGN